MKTFFNNQSLYIYISGFFAILTIAYISYTPGLGGLFIFDDMPNLKILGQYTNLTTWDNFWLFLLEGNSGPTGRPISLASFYLNDTAWPSSPSSFVQTNLSIHLLNGILIYWLLYKLSKILKLSSTQAVIFTLLGTALWVLHPLHTTTVLYIIQRMTELSALFTLAALLFYLYGREAIDIQPLKGFLLLIFGVGTSMLLAILSKENAILFVSYVLTIEFFLLRPLKIHTPKYLNLWLTIFIVIPFAGLAWYLISLGLQNYTGERDFNAYERLLTEARVIFNYLYHIILPHNGGTGLFHDDYIISRSLLTPWTTLPSVIGVFGLVIGMFYLRNKKPLLAFSIAWFIGGHLLESTTLLLEIYFEHRNYLPMLGFFIAIAWFVATTDRLKKIIVPSSFLVVCLLSILTFMNATLWSSPKNLIADWHQYHPKSIRVQEAYQLVIGNLPNKNTSNQYNEKKKGLAPYQSLKLLNEKCRSNKLSNLSLLQSSQIFKKERVTKSSVEALSQLMDTWEASYCQSTTAHDLIIYLENVLSHKSTTQNTDFIHLTHYWLYRLYTADNNLNGSMVNLEAAYHLKPNIDLLLLQARVLSSAGLYNEAIKVLNNTQLLEHTIRKKLILKVREKEINTLKQDIVYIMQSKN